MDRATTAFLEYLKQRLKIETDPEIIAAITELIWVLKEKDKT